MNTNIIVSLFLLCIISLSCNVSCEDGDLPYEGFLRAFPHANISALLELERPFTVASYPYNPPPFMCSPISLPPDTNDVNNLRPGNIKVVMAMGDSISAGMSIYDDWIISLKEYRGSAFSIGAENGRYTIPNFMTACGFTTFGASIGGSRKSTSNGFNAAMSGAKSQDLPAQAVWLVEQLRRSPNINYLEDWKLLTIWIGSNNLCDVCNDFNGNNGVVYENNLVAALNYIADNVPRVFVNLVAPLNVAKLWEIEGAICATIHAVACPCAGSIFNSDRALVTQVAQDYVARSYNIARQFNGLKSDFAVVVQPFLEELSVSQRQLVSKADCFHPSAKGHALGAVALWNNMLTPSNLKKKSWNEADTPICPTGDHMLHTN